MKTAAKSCLGKAIVGAWLTACAVATAGEAAAAGAWSSGTPLPSALTWSAAALVGGKIYVVGGIDAANAATSAVEVYDPATSAWSAGVALPVAVWGATAASVKNKLYVFGGYSPNASAAVYEFNSKSKKWISRAAMLTPQGSARAVVNKNIVYVIGGNSASQQRIATVESYDPAANSWTAQPSLRVGKSEASAGLVGGTIVAADGYTAGGDTGDNESLTIGGANWVALASDPTPRNGACTGAIGGNLYVADGDNNANAPISVVESYNLKKNKWSALPAMPHTVTDMSFVVYNKQLYCIGGGSSATPFQGSAFTYVQVYTP
ncbi:MAG: hypothetical protein WDN04_06815 [Rhodospirillales bacterium]